MPSGFQKEWTAASVGVKTPNPLPPLHAASFLIRSPFSCLTGTWVRRRPPALRATLAMRRKKLTDERGATRRRRGKFGGADDGGRGRGNEDPNRWHGARQRLRLLDSRGSPKTSIRGEGVSMRQLASYHLEMIYLVTTTMDLRMSWVPPVTVSMFWHKEKHHMKSVVVDSITGCIGLDQRISSGRTSCICRDVSSSLFYMLKHGPSCPGRHLIYVKICSKERLCQIPSLEDFPKVDTNKSFPCATYILREVDHHRKTLHKYALAVFPIYVSYRAYRRSSPHFSCSSSDTLPWLQPPRFGSSTDLTTLAPCWIAADVFLRLARICYRHQGYGFSYHPCTVVNMVIIMVRSGPMFVALLLAVKYHRG